MKRRGAGQRGHWEGRERKPETNIFDPSEVMAVLRRLEVSSLENSMTSAVRSSSATATAQARSKPSAIRMGWIPLSRSDSDAERRAPARTRGQRGVQRMSNSLWKLTQKQSEQAEMEKELTNDTGGSVSNLVVLRL